MNGVNKINVDKYYIVVCVFRSGEGVIQTKSSGWMIFETTCYYTHCELRPLVLACVR